MKEGANEYHHLYGREWRRQRKVFLLLHPLCTFCEESGRVRAATVVDHIKPHKGDVVLFWDTDNWQSLCKQCHDAAKQAEEKRGYSTAIGLDGYPIDPKHPANRGNL